MPHIEWKESFSVGIDEIDEQNRWLIDYINELDRIVKKGGSRGEIRDIINKLCNYTGEHFRIEEGHIKNLDHDEYETHRREHSLFIRQLSRFREDFVKGNRHLTEDMLNFLLDWFKDHINEKDQDYSIHRYRIAR